MPTLQHSFFQGMGKCYAQSLLAILHLPRPILLFRAVLRQANTHAVPPPYVQKHAANSITIFCIQILRTAKRQACRQCCTNLGRRGCAQVWPRSSQ